MVLQDPKLVSVSQNNFLPPGVPLSPKVLCLKKLFRVPNDPESQRDPVFVSLPKAFVSQIRVSKDPKGTIAASLRTLLTSQNAVYFDDFHLLIEYLKGSPKGLHSNMSVSL